MRALRFGALTLVAAMLAMPANADGQLGALKKRAEEEAKKRTDASAKKAVEDSAKKAAEKKKADSTKAAASQPAAPSKPNAATPQDATATQGQGAPKVWENYDFVPGSKVIFYTDFSEDRVGNFARGLRFRNGPAEVVEREGVKMLRATARSEFLIPVGRKLPERFTLEIDVIAPGANAAEAVSFEGGAQFDRGPTSAAISWNPLRSFYLGSGGDATSTVKYPDDVPPTLIGKVAHLRVLMDSGYFKFFVNEARIYNRPEFPVQRDSVNRLSLDAREETERRSYLRGIPVPEK